MIPALFEDQEQFVEFTIWKYLAALTIQIIIIIYVTTQKSKISWRLTYMYFKWGLPDIASTNAIHYKKKNCVIPTGEAYM